MMKSFIHKKKFLRIIVWLIVFALALLCKFFNICEVSDFFFYLFLILLLVVIILYIMIKYLPKHWQDLVATAIIYILVIGLLLTFLIFLVDYIKLSHDYSNYLTVIMISVGILLFPIEKIFEKEEKNKK